MLKHSLLLSALLCIYTSCLATNVSGLISTNTTWSKANNPYIVTGDIDVDTGKTLTIEAGVQVLFNGNYTLYVDGKISAVGTQTDSILFASNKLNPGKSEWHGIYVRYANNLDTFSFSYCHFRNGYIALFLRFTPAIVNNCLFDQNNTGIEDFTASGSYVSLTHCSFSNHDNAGAWLSEESIVTDCVFTHNNKGVHGSGLVNNSQFYYNKTGIEQGKNVQGNVIAGSSSNALDGCNGIISLNQLWYNHVAINYLAGSVVHNGIKYNEIGIEMRAPVYANGSIANNCVDSNSKYNFANRTSQNIGIANNYWGVTDLDTITKYIYDFKNDFALGRVSFQPILSNADSGCAASITLPVDTTTGIKVLSVTNGMSVYPNPVTSSLTFASVNINKLQDISIYNITGALVLHNTCNDQKIVIDVSSLTPGIYIYKAYLSDNTMAIGKLIKE